MFAEFDTSKPIFQNQWLVENCAEVWAVRDAILRGAEFDKIILRLVRIKDGVKSHFV